MEERNDEIGTFLYRWSMAVQNCLPSTIQTPQTAKSIWIWSDRSLEQRECLNCTGLRDWHQVTLQKFLKIRLDQRRFLQKLPAMETGYALLNCLRWEDIVLLLLSLWDAPLCATARAGAVSYFPPFRLQNELMNTISHGIKSLRFLNNFDIFSFLFFLPFNRVTCGNCVLIRFHVFLVCHVWRLSVSMCGSSRCRVISE